MTKLITLDRFRDLQAISNEDLCRQVAGEFVQQPRHVKEKCLAQSKKGGIVFIYESVNEPGYLIEQVIGLDGSNDFMLTLYRPHAIFNSPSELLKARESLVTMYADMKGADPHSFALADNYRRRMVMLMELGTMQLVQLVQQEIDPYIASGAIQV